MKSTPGIMFSRRLLADLLGAGVAFCPVRAGKYLLMKWGERILSSIGTQVVPLWRDGKAISVFLMLRFPEDVGYLELYYLGYVEFGSVNFLQHFLEPDDVFFDIGANIGYFTLLASHSIPQGQVHAFEPIPSTFDRLCANLALNPEVKNIIPNQLAVARVSGPITLHTFPQLHHGYSSIATFGRSSPVSFLLQACSLDDYVADRRITRLDFLKIDVEGSEKQVLEGASAALRRFAPSVMLEVNFESARANGFKSRDLLVGLLDMHPYSLFRVPKAWGAPTPVVDLDEIEDGDNVIAVSPNHISRLQNSGINVPR